MKTRISAMSCAVSACAIASAAWAQEAPASQENADSTIGEIVVTARRESEGLQDVPQTVNAITGSTLQRLNIKQFEDVQSVVPGLSLQKNAGNPSAALRGVTFDQQSSAQPTVALYVNEAPVQAGFLFQSLYDIGQIEVLKGPQGTTRGISAPSGAITVATRKPDLAEFGGYADLTITNRNAQAIQGAINVPIVSDVLALRVAGVFDHNRFDNVRSIHSNIDPRQRTVSGRASLLYKPSSDFSAAITYQHIDLSQRIFTQVSGAGNGTALNPAITPQQRLAVQDSPERYDSKYDIVIGQIDATVFGHRLSYVGSYQKQRNLSLLTSDPGNVIPGLDLPTFTDIRQTQITQELRISSDTAGERFFDYSVGAFYNRQKTDVSGNLSPILLPGAFGNPAAAPNFTAYDSRFSLPLALSIPGQTVREVSVFGNLTFHIGENTELSGGIRHIWSKQSSSTTIDIGTGLAAAPAFLFGGSCTVPGVFSYVSTYPGFCDVPTPPQPAQTFAFSSDEQPTLYNISLSHKFSPNFMVYANTGTSYRPPVPSIGIQGGLLSSTNPELRALSAHPSEKSRSYEIGFKSTLLDGRAHLNASVYHQKFDNFVLYVPGITYLDTTTAPGSPSNFNFTSSVNAVVKGFDISGDIQLAKGFTLSAQVSYADAKITGSRVPCNITDALGNPVFNTDGLISLCPGGSASRLAPWNATIQAEYTHGFGRVDGFVRALFNYVPDNVNRVQQNFTVPGYGLLNLYTGVRSPDGAWELQLFARNLLNTKRALDVQQVQLNANGLLGAFYPALAQNSGYSRTSVLPRRELGLTLRYAFGSR